MMETKIWKKKHKENEARAKRSYDKFVSAILSHKPDLRGKNWIPIKPYKIDKSLSWKKRVDRLDQHRAKMNGFLIKKLKEVKGEGKLTGSQKRFINEVKKKKSKVVISIPTGNGKKNKGVSKKKGESISNVVKSLSKLGVTWNGTHIPQSVYDEVIQLILSGKKLAAVKAVKFAADMTLKDSKDFVESLRPYTFKIEGIDRELKSFWKKEELITQIKGWGPSMVYLHLAMQNIKTHTNATNTEANKLFKKYR